MGIDDSDDSAEDSESLEDEPPTQPDLASAAGVESTSQSGDHSNVAQNSSESPDASQQSIEDMLLEFDEQQGLIRDRSLLGISGPAHRIQTPEYQRQVVGAITDAANRIEVNINTASKQDDFPSFDH
ncbi:hypothetical protein [Halorubrum halophilum]|uniref:hypothetical protein n=1 Tax=Halorubrum halophilum TaxID=413816 RepID=UPI00186AFDC9|nr:hypothetical protein [Halorubrum halophilum]